jgi:hypothetical protein
VILIYVHIIIQATLHTALVELKKRGFMSVQLSDAELDKVKQ